MAPHLFLTAFMLTIGTSFVKALPLPDPSYQLIRSIQNTTTGSVLLQCREVSSLKLLNVTNTIFRENSTDADLRERDDVTVIETEDQLGIVFNLTRNLEGYYSCGRRTDSNSVYESQPKPLISHQKYIELSEKFETVYTARNGSNATLLCPTPPGRLRQYYSVQWKKDYAVLAQLISGSMEYKIAPRHSIVKTDFSLIIEDVQFDDASTSYECEVFLTDPLSLNGQTRIQLETVPLVTLTLQVNATPLDTSGTNQSTVQDQPTTSNSTGHGTG